MPKCLDCKKYTDFKNGRCKTCYYEHQYRLELDENIDASYDFRIQLTKGKFAEIIFEQMLKLCNYEVHPFGMENSVPSFVESLAERDQTSNEIRSMPDFIIVDPIENKPHYVEVKYRRNGDFKYKNLGDGYKYDNGLLVIFSREGISGYKISEMKKGKFGKGRCPLNKLKPFGCIRDDVLQEFTEITRDVFSRI